MIAFKSIIAFILIQNFVEANNRQGVITLDEYTFDKVILRFKYALVKFAHAYPYGEDHDNYVKVAQSVAHNQDMIVVNIEVKDYGENDSLALAHRFNVTTIHYPSVRLFLNGDLQNPVVFDEKTIKSDDLRIFLRKTIGIRLTLDNCSQELDELADNFIKNDILSERKQIYEYALQVVKKIKDNIKKQNANIYLTLMEKGLERGNAFFESEERRVRNILKGKLKYAKEKELKVKLNVVLSFIDFDKRVKDEL